MNQRMFSGKLSHSWTVEAQEHDGVSVIMQKEPSCKGFRGLVWCVTSLEPRSPLFLRGIEAVMGGAPSCC